MEYNYKLDERVNLTLENIIFFLESFEINDLSKYTNSELVVEGKKFVFFREDIKWLFSHMLSLHNLWAIYFHIGYLGNDFPVSEYQIKWNTQEYLYRNINSYINDIRIWTEIPFWLAIHTEDFLLWYLKILYQEKDISLLENYKILSNIIKSVKSKAGVNVIQKEIDLFYDYDLYKVNLYSIFPILVELSKKWYLNIREIKYDKWEIWFNLRILSDLDNIDQEEIIELFWSEDLYIKKIETNDLLSEWVTINEWLNAGDSKNLIFDWVKIISWTKDKILTGYKLRLAEYIYLLNKDENIYDWWLLIEHIYWRNLAWDWMVNLVKKLNIDFKGIWSELRLWYSEWSHIYIK